MNQEGLATGTGYKRFSFRANKKLVSTIDSLRNECSTLVANQKTDKSELVNSIDKTNELIQATENVLSSRTVWGACVSLSLPTRLNNPFLSYAFPFLFYQFLYADGIYYGDKSHADICKDSFPQGSQSAGT